MLNRVGFKQVGLVQGPGRYKPRFGWWQSPHQLIAFSFPSPGSAVPFFLVGGARLSASGPRGPLAARSNLGVGPVRLLTMLRHSSAVAIEDGR